MHLYKTDPYPHLSKLTFKEFLFSFVFKLYVVYKAQRILEDVPLRPLLQAPAPRGTGPPAEPLVHPCQRALHLLVLPPFLQLLHVHHASCLHLKGVILQKAKTAEKNSCITGWEFSFLRKHNHLLKSTHIFPRPREDPTTYH